MNLIRTAVTYATVKNAEQALTKKLTAIGKSLDTARYVIAVAPDGRFAPVLVGAEYIPFIHVNVTVVG